MLPIRLARENLRAHRLRYSLTTLGVVVGVFMVSFILIISDSLKDNLSKQAGSLSNNTVLVNGSDGIAPSSSSLDLSVARPNNNLTSNDVSNLEKLGFKDLVSSLLINGRLEFNGDTYDNISTVATTANFMNTLGLKTTSGNWFDSHETSKKWVILGNDLANQIVGTTEAQNQVINIKGQNFTVVGVLDKVKQPLSILGYNIDKSAFISLTNGQAVTESKAISQVIVRSNREINQSQVKQINVALSREHSDNSEYQINTSESLRRNLTATLNFISLISFIFAGMTLLISGISIMNIMLVNVIERQHEIGIRKAVGATSRDILNQFVTESLILTVRGGIIGIVLAYIIAAITLIYFSATICFSWLAILVGFIVPIVIGVFFGAYPAYRAARQDIIRALKQLT